MSHLIVRFQTSLPKRPDGSKHPPARFALLLHNTQHQSVVENDIRAEFSAFSVEIRPLSSRESRILLLTLLEHLMTADPPTAFSLTYQLIDRFGLENAEPEIFTDLMPERSAPRPKPGEESLDDLIPGCWVDPDTAIDQTPDWALAAMKIREAWQASTNTERPSQGEGAFIAQIDTGLTQHPELAEAGLRPGYDFVRGKPGSEDPMDYDGNPGHGTATASVIISPAAGKVTGVAPRVAFMPLRAIESVVRVSQVAVAEAIDYAVENGAHIITMSLGGLPSISLWRALNRAVDANVIVLAAAGNCIGYVVFPARYEACLAIGATNKANGVWQGSSTGPDVDICAPGENVYAARAARDVKGGLAFTSAQSQGTSFAVALTAGVAALWLAHHGRDALIAQARKLDEPLQDMFRRLVRASAFRPGPAWDATQMGAGIVNASDLIGAPLDAGRDREAFGVARTGTTADAMRRLVLEATKSAEAAQGDVDWERYGPEIAYGLLSHARSPGRQDAMRESPLEGRGFSAEPALSAELSNALADIPSLGRALNVGAEQLT